ncbi:MAG TPA: PEP-CTERM sorting domain-containing protein [Chthonomonadaceae bacterium]|nr:PEP-CTERM sorting domain-containing protein [Chthonomonadaceae bacterium]
MKRLWIWGTLLGLAAAATAQADPRYFLVAGRPGLPQITDSYVLPLEEPQDIAHAQALIAQGPDIGAGIVVAAIQAGADGINRDYLAPGAPPWSWHVTQFEGFADFTIELYDGSPTLVEEDVPGWIANTGGHIGFWNYTVVAELPAGVPEPSAFAVFGLGSLGLLGLARRRLHPYPAFTMRRAPRRRAGL